MSGDCSTLSVYPGLTSMKKIAVMAGAVLMLTSGATLAESVTVAGTPMCQHGDLIEPCLSGDPISRLVTPMVPGSGDLAAPKKDWHLLTQTENGTVTLLKDLTQHECEFTRNRLLGNPATDEEIAAAKRQVDELRARWEAWKTAHNCHGNTSSWSSGPSRVESDGTCTQGEDMGVSMSSHMVMPSDIKSAECFR